MGAPSIMHIIYANLGCGELRTTESGGFLGILETAVEFRERKSLDVGVDRSVGCDATHRITADPIKAGRYKNMVNKKENRQCTVIERRTDD